jgi:hypothetical protein
MVRGGGPALFLAAMLCAAGCRTPGRDPALRSLRAERDRAVAAGYAWLARFLDDPRNVDALGVDAVRIFSEPAATMPDQASRRRWLWEACRKARCFTMLRMRREVLLGIWDLLDVFEFAAHAREIGLCAAPLTGRARAALAACPSREVLLPSGPFAPGYLSTASEQELLDLLLAAYSIEKAEIAGEPLGLSRGLAEVLPLLRGHRFETDPAADSFRDSVYLAAHVAFVASDYGRVRLRREDAPWVSDYLFEAWPAVLAARDLELVAEIADVARSFGLDEHDDPLLHAATRLLLDAQNPDGSWGPGPAPGSPYGAMHPTWCATGGLRERVFLPDTPWEHRIRPILRGARRRRRP